VNRLLDASPFGAVLQAVTDASRCREMIDRYVQDYTRMVYIPRSKLSDEELQVFTAFLE